MNLLRYITPLALLCLICIASCKKDKKKTDDPVVATETPAAITTMLNTSNTAALKYQDALQSGGDSIDALLAMGKWLSAQPDVERAAAFGPNIVNVYYKNGMMNVINIVHTDANGRSYARGGGGEAGGDGAGEKLAFHNVMRSAGDDHIIENKKVLILSPFDDDFYPYPDYYPFLPKFTQGKYKLEPTLITRKNVTLSVLNTMKDYGFIIINTHGLPKGFLIKNQVDILDIPHAPGSKIYTQEFVRELFTDLNGMPLERFQNGDLILCVTLYEKSSSNAVFVSELTLVTDKYIRTLPGLDKAIVFGNFCYSGWTAPHPLAGNVADAFKSIGAISYYGYSYSDGTASSVNNKFAIEMEDSLISNLVAGDSTGVAHLYNNFSAYSNAEEPRRDPEEVPLTQDATREGLVFRFIYTGPTTESLVFRHHHDERYKYGGCESFTDSRDGEVYQTACIGDQQWMAENLRYNAAGSLVYDNDNSKLATYGRLYTYGMVSAGAGIGSETGPGLPGICPNGWHIPNRQDYEKMIAHLNTIAPSNKHGLLLKGKTLWQNDSQSEIDDPLRNITRFNAFPGGIGKNATSGLAFFYGGQEAQFWASSLLSTSSLPNTVGIYTLSGTSIAVSPLTLGSDNSYRSCRCVKN